MPIKLIQPNWSAPSSVKGFCTTRKGGCSEQPWQSLNLALHVGDNQEHVFKNRELLAKISGLPSPHWLEQVHSTKVIPHDSDNTIADGCFTQKSNQACIVMTADCLPILLTDESGSWVAAVHAGWRGLADGIINQAIEQYSGNHRLLAWIGPAISQEFFEVGDEVRTRFVNKNKDLSCFFEANSNQRWQCDLAGIAQHILEQSKLSAGNIEVFQSGLCSYANPDDFYSHRRETHKHGADATTGRMASAIWIEQ